LAARVARELAVVFEAGRGPAHLILVLAEGLAALHRQRAGNLVAALLYAARDLAQELRLLVRGALAPRLEGFLRPRGGLIHLFGGVVRDLAEDFLRGGIQDGNLLHGITSGICARRGSSCRDRPACARRRRRRPPTERAAGRRRAGASSGRSGRRL